MLLLALATLSCAASRTRRVARPQALAPALNASAAQLAAEINSQSQAVHSLSATVDFEASTGSAYAGLIKQYHKIRGFILMERPQWIRVVGQAPIVGTDIFDMASDGKTFSLYIPSRNKFYVGPDSAASKTPNSLEDLRPQHILNALLLQPINEAKSAYFIEESQQGPVRYYILMITATAGPGIVRLERKIWFDRSDLSIARVQVYGTGGVDLEDIDYSNYETFSEVHYPAQISIRRPVEGYSLTITILSAHFNQPVPVSKFILKKPAGALQIDVGSDSRSEGFRDQ